MSKSISTPRVDVLDEVKPVNLLLGKYATMKMVAEYFDVSVETIKSLVKDNRSELVNSGYIVVSGQARQEFLDRIDSHYSIERRGRSMSVFTKETLLVVAHLLTKSDVAVQVCDRLGQLRRRYLTSKEYETLGIISRTFAHLEQERERPIGPYFVDLYFPQFRIAVECDENGHADRDQACEKTREEYVTRALDCEFVRFNPDAAGFNIGDTLNDLVMRMRLPV